jgi:hypothetical protein
MFRFFCTIEQRVKRVRQIPTNIDKSTISLGDPSLRLGQCNSHFVERIKVIKSNRPIKVEPVVTNKSRRKR